MPLRVPRRSALVARQHLRMPNDFPQMTVRVLEVAGVTTPESVLSRLDHDGTRLLRLRHHSINFFPRPDVVPEGELCGAWVAQRQTCILGEALARPNCQL